MNASSRRQQHKDELRRVILDAAREIFVHEGYEKLSMRKLAEKIEYSPASVYLHFNSKEELFECLVEESFARLLKTLTGLGNGRKWQDPVEELKKGMRAYVDFGLRNPNDYRFAFMLRRPVEKRRYKAHPAFEVLRQIVKRCVDEKRFRGQFRDIDVEGTSQALWSSVHGITSLLIQRPDFPWVPKKKLITQVIRTAIDGLLAAPNATAGTMRQHANIIRQ
jgi:AcrR family transcriptional regulator